MILMTFTHGIGDFNTDKGRLQSLSLQNIVGGYRYSLGYTGQPIQVEPLYYEDYLDSRPTSRVIAAAARLAAAKYARVLALGSILADYGSDVLEYYLSRKVREDITTLLVKRLEDLVRLHDKTSRVTRIVLVGHSLGSLVVLHLLKALTGRPLCGDRFIDIQVLLIGSPAFSRVLPGVRLGTQKLALSGVPFRKLAEECLRHGAPIVNAFSDSSILDPLAGPAGGAFLDVPVPLACHHDVDTHFSAVLKDPVAGPRLFG